MRVLFLCDQKITDKELKTLTDAFTALVKRYTDITPMYFIERHDYTSVPTELDNDGDARLTQAYMKTLHDNILKRYSTDGVDYVKLLIHEDNWMSSGVNFDKFRASFGLPIKKGIWGTAWAYKYHSFLTTYCRWDKGNMANNLGTVYHETCHPMDALISVELGVNIHKIVETELRKKYANASEIISYLDKNGFNWDRDFVHGAMNPPFKYIRHKDNTEVLEIAAPYLREAFKKREERHLAYMGLQRKAIGLLEQVVYLLRKKFYMKDGVPRQ